jgi:hypothetical protein
MIQYDPQMIHEHAERLHAQAKTIIPIQFFIGIFSGIIIFGGITALLGIGYDFLLVAILGHGAGRSKAFELKLQAHMALCQLKIEENTRKK